MENQILLALLDWPVLFTVSFFILLLMFRADIRQLFTRGRISLTWGDKNFEVSDLPEELDENFAPIADDIEDLKQRIQALEAALANKPGTPKSQVPDMEAPVSTTFDPEPDAEPNAAPGAPPASPSADAITRDRMLNALNNSQYTWRNIDRLASISGVSDEKAEELLRGMDEVVFSRNRKSGRSIVKLKSS